MADRTVLDRLPNRKLSQLELDRATRTLRRAAVAVGGSAVELHEALLMCGIDAERLKAPLGSPDKSGAGSGAQRRSGAPKALPTGSCGNNHPWTAETAHWREDRKRWACRVCNRNSEASRRERQRDLETYR